MPGSCSPSLLELPWMLAGAGAGAGPMGGGEDWSSARHCSGERRLPPYVKPSPEEHSPTHCDHCHCACTCCLITSELRSTHLGRTPEVMRGSPLSHKRRCAPGIKLYQILPRVFDRRPFPFLVLAVVRGRTCSASAWTALGLPGSQPPSDAACTPCHEQPNCSAVTVS